MLGPIIIYGVLILFVGFLYFQYRLESSLQYREYLYEQVQLKDMCAETVEFFERHTREMERLGFDVIGDYVLSRKPMWHLTRYFAGPNPCVFGDIDETTNMRSCNYMSIFSDGTVLESSSVGLFKGRKLRYIEEDFYRVKHVPGATVEELHAGHLEVSDRYCDRHGCHMLSFEPEQFREVSKHIHRMSHWGLHQRGAVPEPPPELFTAETAESEVLSSRESSPAKTLSGLDA